MDRDDSYLIDGWLEDAFETRVSGSGDEAIISETRAESNIPMDTSTGDNTGTAAVSTFTTSY